MKEFGKVIHVNIKANDIESASKIANEIVDHTLQTYTHRITGIGVTALQHPYVPEELQGE